MKRLLGLLVFLVAFYSTTLAQRQNLSGFCEKGNETVLTDGRNSTTKVQRSYPSCSVTVFDAGTLNLSTIASDLGGTPKANPFIADTNGFWNFYAVDGRYDVRISGSGLASPITLPGKWIISTSGGSGDVTGPGSSTDNALARFDGTTGKIIQNSLITLSDSGGLSFPTDVRQTFAPGANNSGLNVGSRTADPTNPSNGDVYYNSSIGSFRCFENGLWINCASAGDVVGPGSATDNAIVRFDLATGKLIQNSVVIIGDTGNVSGLGTLNTHTIPAVGADTFALLQATQTFANKVLDNTTDFSGFYDITGIGAPANPSVGLARVFFNSSTGFLACLTSAGANCMPSGGGGGTPGGSSGQIQWNSAGSFAGVAGSVITSLGEVTLATTARTSGSASAYFFKTPADTTLAADTEARLMIFGGDGINTVTRQFTAAGGAFTTQREYVFYEPTYGFTSADTITNAATVAIRNAPQQGTNATFTNAYALWVQAGQALFAGTVITTASGTQAAFRMGSHTADPSATTEGNMYYNSTTDVFKASMNGTFQIIAMTDFVNAWGDGVKQTFNPNNTNAGINVGANATDPGTPVNGDIFYDSTNNTLDARINGAWVSLGAGGGAPGGSSGNIQWNSGGAFAGVAGSVITSIGEVKLNNTARTSGGSVRAFQQITSADTGLTPDTESIFMQFGGTTASPPVSATRTFTQAGGAFGVQREYVFVAPTYAFNAGDTIGTPVTVSITGAPIAGTNATLTTPLALWIESGNALFAANVSAATLNVTGLVQTGPITYTAATKTLDIRANTYNDLPNAEAIINQFDLGFSPTMNFVGGGGTIATQRGFMIFRQASITADAAQTITVGATFAIDGPPVAGTNITLTTPLTAWFMSGAVQFGQSSTSTGSIRLAVSGDADVTTIQAGDTPASSVVYKWPADDPAAAEFLKVTSFSGGVAVLEWAAGGGGSGCTSAGASGTYQMSDGAGGCSASVTTQGSNGKVIVSPSTASSGVIPYLRIVASADTAQTLNTEFPGIFLGGSSTGTTVTRQGADGTTYALQREIIAPAVTYGFVGATTVTLAIGADFASPIAGTNATFTESVGLRASASSSGASQIAMLAETANANDQIGLIVRHPTVSPNRGFFLYPSFTSFGTQDPQLRMSSGGAQTWGTGLIIEQTGKIYTMAANVSQVGTRDTSRVGGYFRLDLRTTAESGGTFINGDRSFYIIGQATGGSSDVTRLVVSLQGGDTLIAPNGGTVGIGITTAATEQLNVTSGSASRVGLNIVSATNSTVDAVDINTNVDDTSTNASIMGIITNSNGSPAAGFGANIFFGLESSTTQGTFSGSIKNQWTDVTHATRTSDFVLNLLDSGTAQDAMTLRGNGQIKYLGLKRATSDLTRNNTTTFADIPGLTFNVVNGRTYKVKARISYNALAGTGGGSKITLSGTATFSSVLGNGFAMGTEGAVHEFVTSSSFRLTALGGSWGESTAGEASAGGTYDAEALLICNGSGTLVVQGTQKSADTDTTTFLTNSTFEIWEVSN